MPRVDTAAVRDTAPFSKAKSLAAKKPIKKPEGLVIHDLTELNIARGVRTIAATESRDAAIRECRRKVEKISRECRMDNVKYRDPHFDLSAMPEFCLNGLKQDTGEADCVADPSACKRVGDIYDEPKFIVDGIDAGDIKQGGAGDCWFLAAVATIANMPSLLESICVARDEKVGVYGFIFFRDGEWISEVIDDQLFITHPSYAEADYDLKRAFANEQEYVKALQRGSNALHFAKCEDSNETWLPLLEKAYAKAHGDYAAIEGGFTGEGVEDLTGGVTTEILCEDILDRDVFWNDELTKVNQELLFAGAISGVAAADVNGIITNHAYSVLKAVEINNKRFVKVRNPWGQSEWTGRWSDGSSEWTAEWMTLLEHKFGDDGAFWMAYEDFLSTFTMIDRTRVFSAEWTVAQAWTQCPVAWPAGFAEQQFSITLTQSGPVVIVLQQADTRYFLGLDGQYDFRLHFRVRKQGESEYFARTKQTLTMNRSVNKELYLEAGTWIVSFRVSRSPSYRTRRGEYIDKYQKEQSSKFLVVARNFDYAHAKGVVGDLEWEDEEEVEEEPVQQIKPKKTSVHKIALKATPAEEEQEEGEQAEEGEGEEGDEGEGEEEEEEEEEEDHSEEDTTAVIGIRVHAKDPKLEVASVTPEEGVSEELDPDDSSVTAFLNSSPLQAGFLSANLHP